MGDELLADRREAAAKGRVRHVLEKSIELGPARLERDAELQHAAQHVLVGVIPVAISTIV
ncbi:MAG: hypothetical protein V3R91_05775 [Myxococcota bacterium]